MWALKWMFGGIAVLAIAGAAVVFFVFGLIPLAIAGVAIAALAAAAATVSYKLERYYKLNNKNAEKLRELNNTLNNMKQDIFALENKLADQSLLTKKIQENDAKIQELIAQFDVDGRLRDDLERAYHDEMRKNAQYREFYELHHEEIAALMASRGGDGYSSNNDREHLYYSALQLNKLLFAMLKEKFHAELNNENLAIVKRKSNDKFITIISPTMRSDNIGLLLGALLESKIFKENADVKILLPFLDKNHWTTAEIIYNANQKQLTLIQHDPRGGGQFSAEIAQQFFAAFQKHVDANISCDNQESLYQTCRQSKVDKISCGPIVIDELQKLAKGKSLDRNFPYEFAARELVEKQSCYGDQQFILFKKYRETNLVPDFLEKRPTLSLRI